MTAQLVDEIAASAEMIRSRSRRLYKDIDLLRRLTAQHAELVARLASIDTPENGDTHE